MYIQAIGILLLSCWILTLQAQEIPLDTETIPNEKVEGWRAQVKKLNQEGLYYRRGGELELARAALHSSKDLAESNGGFMPMTYYQLAFLHAKMNNLDSTMHYFTQCEQYVRKLKSSEPLCLFLSLRADTQKQFGNYEQALADRQELHSIHVDSSDKFAVGPNLFEQADILFEMGDLQAALHTVDQSMAIGDELKIRDTYMNRIRQLRSKIQTSLANPESLASISSTDLPLGPRKFKTMQRLLMREKMELNNELQGLKIKKQRTILVILASASLIFLGMVYLLVRMNKRIVSQNKIISKSLHEKDFLLREIHHRVKNNLQIISSLLSLQSRTMENETAVSALIDGRSRVESMALIHQDLYEEDNLTGIQVEGYIEKLCHNLYATYNVKGDRVLLFVEVDPVSLDVNTLIPLGLILNELIANALKYAFPDDRQGRLTVSLREKSNHLVLQVRDDGVGMHENEKSGFGQRLIKAFAKKLEAEIEVKHDKGLVVAMKILNYKVA